MSKEGILSIFKKIEQHETILRNSAVRYSLFSSSLFRSGGFSYEGTAV